jgi:hypothetical protein
MSATSVTEGKVYAVDTRSHKVPEMIEIDDDDEVEVVQVIMSSIVRMRTVKAEPTEKPEIEEVDLDDDLQPEMTAPTRSAGKINSMQCFLTRFYGTNLRFGSVSWFVCCETLVLGPVL